MHLWQMTSTWYDMLAAAQLPSTTEQQSDRQFARTVGEFGNGKHTFFCMSSNLRFLTLSCC